MSCEAVFQRIRTFWLLKQFKNVSLRTGTLKHFTTEYFILKNFPTCLIKVYFWLCKEIYFNRNSRALW